MTEWLLLALVVVLITANALFVAAEFSLVTVDRTSVERRAQDGDRRAEGVLQALRTLSTQLSGAQLGITVTSLVVGFVAEPSIAALLRGPLGLTGLSDAALTATAFTIAFLVATGAQMVFGELVPKNWAIAEPMRVGRAVAGFQRGFTRLAGPLIRLLNGMANAVLRAVGVEPQEELASARSPEELASLARRSARQGTLEPGTAELLTRSIEFGDRRAADVMTPRPRVRFLSADATAQDVVDLAVRTGHARFPVTGDGVDDVIGMVHFKHAVAVPYEERATRRVRDVVHELPAVPASMELDPLLGVLRTAGPQMALVVDEYGGTDGIVTLEDLVEEIVGEIEDEQDRPVGRVRELPDGGWSLSGLLRPDEAEDITGLRLPEAEESDTLGGLVTEHLGRLPDVGDTVDLEAGDLADVDEVGVPARVVVTLEVARLDGFRVDRLRLRRHPRAADVGRAREDDGADSAVGAAGGAGGTDGADDGRADR
ncbi:hemolysin family protein [Thalassiella azotivora]